MKLAGRELHADLARSLPSSVGFKAHLGEEPLATSEELAQPMRGLFQVSASAARSLCTEAWFHRSYLRRSQIGRWVHGLKMMVRRERGHLTMARRTHISESTPVSGLHAGYDSWQIAATATFLPPLHRESS
jgi:hypothetical protein